MSAGPKHAVDMGRKGSGKMVAGNKEVTPPVNSGKGMGKNLGSMAASKGKAPKIPGERRK